ncbi:MAG: hypothetical protein ACRD32_04815 [Nitrososphaerales archaeon]
MARGIGRTKTRHHSAYNRARGLDPVPPIYQQRVTRPFVSVAPDPSQRIREIMRIPQIAEPFIEPDFEPDFAQEDEEFYEDDDDYFSDYFDQY